MKKILIIDDNMYMRFVLSEILEKEGFIPLAAGDAQTAIEEIAANKPDAIILDKKLGDYDGIELLKIIKNTDPDLPVIVLTAYAEDKNSEEAMNAGAFNFITKPFDNNDIIANINKATST